MSGRAIEVAVSHVTLGLMLGSIIEAVLPPFRDTTNVRIQMLELGVQVGLNGLILGYFAQWLSQNDPTFGIPFSSSLQAAQPDLQKRMQKAGELMKSGVAKASLLAAARLA